jgi:hypothetical protein
MSEDRRDVLQVLRYELNFLEQGGYSRNIRQGNGISPFQDTLSCLNFGEPTHPHTCHECFLYDFVPDASRTEDVPCHFIPLDDHGSTVAGLLHSGDNHKLELMLQAWLRKAIAKFEGERSPASAV